MSAVTRPAVGALPSSPVLIDDAAVASHLLSRKFFLAALELHQELLEGNDGVHNVSVLNKFFNDPSNYASLVKRVEDEEVKNKLNGECIFILTVCGTVLVWCFVV